MKAKVLKARREAERKIRLIRKMEKAVGSMSLDENPTSPLAATNA